MHYGHENWAKWMTFMACGKYRVKPKCTRRETALDQKLRRERHQDSELTKEAKLINRI